MDPGILQRLANGRELTLATVDQQHVRPVTLGAVRILLFEASEAAAQNLAHHREVVARHRPLALDVELAVAVLAKAFGPGDDHRADRIGAHDMAVVVDFDPVRRPLQLEQLRKRSEVLVL